MPDDPATATAFLVREHYRALGCFTWNKPRFTRLCAKLNETELELAARVGLSPANLRLRIEADAFTPAEGILLTLLDRAVDTMKSGIIPDDELFPPLHPQ